MNDWLLDIIRCPITGQKLRPAAAELIQRLTSLQQQGQLYSHKGIAIVQAFGGGLVNHDQSYFYCMVDNIPSLLPDEAIRCEG